jgi:pyruvate,water dikinase
VELPGKLLDEIQAAYERLQGRLGQTPRLAVRSSAIGEDSGLSYAGQFMTVLNVDRRGVASAYLSVLASLFSPEAIQYRLMHGITGTALAMAVGCIAMVDARASGIMYSNDPGDPDPGRVVIHAVWGLGALLADGGESPEEILTSREAEPRVLSRKASGQTVALECGEEPGVAQRQIDATRRAAMTLTESQALELARDALILENHFGKAQDIEWALDKEGGILLLQSRPLRMSAGAKRTGKPVEGADVLLQGGDTACPGAGTGPVVIFDEDLPPDSFPDGGILVARISSPKFVHVMSRARAIVTDIGSVTGHMASLTREFHVPALLNTKNATHTLRAGDVVTVDAANGFVYGGNVEAVRAAAAATPISATAPAATPRSPGEVLLARAAEYIIPLHLTNPRCPQFRIENCRTLHDLARFIHEKSFQEMFRIGEEMGDMRSAGYMLDVFLPIDLYIIDIGGGLNPPQKGRRVRPGQILSPPLAAMVRGMLHPEIQRYGAKPISAGGFFSLMMRHAINNPEGEKSFSDPSYAIVSENYLNYTARVGYHFSVVDTYCGMTANKNYINVLFRGGAADRVRRARRAQVIADILKEYGFSATVRHDTVNGRLGKAERADICDNLDILGRLFQFMRQMDVAMSDDAAAKAIKEAFLKGDYGMRNLSGSGKINGQKHES